mgnify:CR=1 FL=1
MSHINADNNSGVGVFATATKNVTLVCASAYGNNKGFDLKSGGTMTLTGVHSYYNANPDLLSYITLHRTYACP